MSCEQCEAAVRLFPTSSYCGRVPIGNSYCELNTIEHAPRSQHSEYPILIMRLELFNIKLSNSYSPVRFRISIAPSTQADQWSIMRINRCRSKGQLGVLFGSSDLKLRPCFVGLLYKFYCLLIPVSRRCFRFSQLFCSPCFSYVFFHISLSSKFRSPFFGQLVGGYLLFESAILREWFSPSTASRGISLTSAENAEFFAQKHSIWFIGLEAEIARKPATMSVAQCLWCISNRNF